MDNFVIKWQRDYAKVTNVMTSVGNQKGLITHTFAQRYHHSEFCQTKCTTIDFPCFCFVKIRCFCMWSRKKLLPLWCDTLVIFERLHVYNLARSTAMVAYPNWEHLFTCAFSGLNVLTRPMRIHRVIFSVKTSNLPSCVTNVCIHGHEMCIVWKP